MTPVEKTTLILSLGCLLLGIIGAVLIWLNEKRRRQS
jgi:hypothetical protein